MRAKIETGRNNIEGKEECFFCGEPIRDDSGAYMWWLQRKGGEATGFVCLKCARVGTEKRKARLTKRTDYFDEELANYLEVGACIWQKEHKLNRNRR